MNNKSQIDLHLAIEPANKMKLTEPGANCTFTNIADFCISFLLLWLLFFFVAVHLTWSNIIWYPFKAKMRRINPFAFVTYSCCCPLPRALDADGRVAARRVTDGLACLWQSGGGAPVRRTGSARQRQPRWATMSAAATFQGHPDRYGGLLVDLRHEAALQGSSFAELLTGWGRCGE